MIQEILTYSIVALASGIVLWNFYKLVFPDKTKNNDTVGCSSSCSCDSKETKSKLLKSSNLK